MTFNHRGSANRYLHKAGGWWFPRLACHFKQSICSSAGLRRRADQLRPVPYCRSRNSMLLSASAQLYHVHAVCMLLLFFRLFIRRSRPGPCVLGTSQLHALDSQTGLALTVQCICMCAWPVWHLGLCMCCVSVWLHSCDSPQRPCMAT